MNTEGYKRKLTAILSADVVGYSRLMENNEEATIQTLNTYRNAMSTLIQQHRGRVVEALSRILFGSVQEAGSREEFGSSDSGKLYRGPARGRAKVRAGYRVEQQRGSSSNEQNPSHI
jgi:class 3 adenylate cyclase